jgi:inhibitor of cysteine peptidase
MKKSLLILTALLFFALFGAACQPAPIVDDYELGSDAYVEALDILIMESFPAQVNVLVSGYLPDGCVELHEIAVERQQSTFILTLTSRRPTGEIACTEALVPFEETVPLDVYGLEAGTYMVVAQDVAEIFTLDVDNILQP